MRQYSLLNIDLPFNIRSVITPFVPENQAKLNNNIPI